MYFYHCCVDLEKIKEYKKTVKSLMNRDNAEDITGKTTIDGIQFNLYPKLELSDKLNDIVEDVSSIIFDHIKEEVTLNNCWTVYGKVGLYQKCHRHNDKTNDVATVLYLNAPDDYDSPRQHGSFYFFNGRDAHVIQPHTGDLFIFPTQMYHGTYPSKKNGRFTLSMDFRRKYQSII